MFFLYFVKYSWKTKLAKTFLTEIKVFLARSHPKISFCETQKNIKMLSYFRKQFCTFFHTLTKEKFQASFGGFKLENRPTLVMICQVKMNELFALIWFVFCTCHKKKKILAMEFHRYILIEDNIFWNFSFGFVWNF